MQCLPVYTDGHKKFGISAKDQGTLSRRQVYRVSGRTTYIPVNSQRDKSRLPLTIIVVRPISTGYELEHNVCKLDAVKCASIIVLRKNGMAQTDSAACFFDFFFIYKRILS